jgi:hypothetical protein
MSVRNDLPAEIGEFLVNALESHGWICVVFCCQERLPVGAAEFKAVSFASLEVQRIAMNHSGTPRNPIVGYRAPRESQWKGAFSKSQNLPINSKMRCRRRFVRNRRR